MSKQKDLAIVNGQIRVPFRLISKKFQKRNRSSDDAKPGAAEKETLATSKQIESTFTQLSQEFRKTNFA